MSMERGRFGNVVVLRVTELETARLLAARCAREIAGRALLRSLLASDARAPQTCSRRRGGRP